MGHTAVIRVLLAAAVAVCRPAGLLAAAVAMYRPAALLGASVAVFTPVALLAQEAPQELPKPPVSQPAGGAPAAAGARSSQAVREFLGLGPAPDSAAAKAGAPVYGANCAFCHGLQARGAQGPSLVYSELVLEDPDGSHIAQFLKGGRPDKGMPAFPTLSDEQRRDLVEYLRQQVEDVANRGTYRVNDILLGDARKGARYVAAHCLGCHSLSGDLRGLGAKWRPVDLQRYWIMPPRTDASRAITASVRVPQGTLKGRVQQIDDFRIILVQDSGQLVSIDRDPAVLVTLQDPLAPHVAMVGNLSDSDMINVTAYLESLK